MILAKLFEGLGSYLAILLQVLGVLDSFGARYVATSELVH